MKFTKAFTIAFLFPHTAAAFAGAAPAWIQRYNGPAGGDDAATSCAIDAIGNVYVCGRSWGDTSFYDIVALKYNSEGTLLWEHRYDGSARRNESHGHVQTDKGGNAYVVCQSEYPDSLSEVVTIKYDSSGLVTWERRWRSDSDSTFYPMQLAVDSTSNALVLAFSGQQPYEGVVLKYSSLGALVWVSRFGSLVPAPAPPWNTGLSLDHRGNVWLAANRVIDPASLVMAGIVFKLDPGGQVVAVDSSWASAHYTVSHLVDVAVDNTGNAFVVGNVDGNSMTAKYDSSGSLVWIREEPIAWRAVAAAPDNQGGTYATAWFNAILRYDRNGALLWSRTSPDMEAPLAVEASRRGGVFVSGCGAEGYVFEQYGGSGFKSWNAMYPASRSDCQVIGASLSVCPDSAIVAAITESGDIVVLKYIPGMTDTSGGRCVELAAALVCFDSVFGQGQTHLETENGGPALPLGLRLVGPAGIGVLHLTSTAAFSGPITFCLSYDTLSVFGSEAQLALLFWRTTTGTWEDVTASVDTVSHRICGSLPDTGLCALVEPCTCPCHADPVCDETLDVLDVVRVIDRAFRGAPGTYDPDCTPHLVPVDGRADVDCSGATDVLDVVKTVDVAFRGADPSTRFCQPCGT